MARHLAKSGRALRVRTAVGGALTAGALLAAPVAVPAFAGVAHAAPAPDPSDVAGAIAGAVKGATAAHNSRVAAAQTTIKTGITAKNTAQVRTGVGQIRQSNKTFTVQVRGILRGSPAPSDPE
jgi:hypothetical protein